MDDTQNISDAIKTGVENADRANSRKDQFVDIETCETKVPTFGFTEKSWRSDFVLLVEGNRLFVNKAILSLASPVFDTMFQSDFKESQCEEMELPGKKLCDVIEFLQCIYPHTLKQITSESAVKILPLVEEYQVLHIKSRCENALLEKISEETQIEVLFDLMHVAFLYNLVSLRKSCEQLACRKSENEIFEGLEKFPPPSEAAKEILEHLSKKMRKTIHEQNLLIDDISREAAEKTQVFESEISDLKKQLVILKQYLASDVKLNKTLSLGSDVSWRECSEVFDVKIGKETIKAKRQVIIWNIDLEINVLEQSISNKGNFLVIEINCNERDVVCLFKGRVVIVNRQPKGVNETILISGSFRDSSWVRSFKQNLMKMSEVRDIAKEFLRDGHIGLIVQIGMTEPNRG